MRKKIIVAGTLLLSVFLYSDILQARPAYPFCKGFFVLTADPVLQYKIIPAPANTWGYDILRDNKIFIHQPNRPGVPGNKGFSTKKDAIKVAQLVISKIKNAEMPPTISTEELHALKLSD